MNEKTLQVSKFYKVSPAKVFKAWSSSEEIKKWFVPNSRMSLSSCEVDFQVGGKYQLKLDPLDKKMIVHGEYLEIIPDKKIVFTWKVEAWPDDMAPTKVTVELKEKNNGTELILVHEELPDEKSLQDHLQGWNGCLSRIEKQFV